MKNSSRSPKSTHHGRHTLERVYRRIASSSLVGTLTRVTKKNSFSGASISAKGVRSKKALSWSAATFHPPRHPQSAALQEQIAQLNQQRMERAKSRRRARERKLQKVWEQEEDSSDGDDQMNYTVKTEPMDYSTDNSSAVLASSSSSSSSTSGQSDRSDDESGCLPAGYVPQLISAVILSLGNLNIGFSLAYHGLAPANHLPPDGPQWLLPWVQNLFNVGGLIGAVLTCLTLHKGRKRPLIFFILVFTASWLLAILAHNSSMIFGARLIAGISAGVITIINQVYIAEMASPKRRGSLGVLPSAYGLLGTLLCFGLSYFVQWRDVAIVGAVLNVPHLILLFLYVPDSPRYLLRIGRISSAAAGLRKLHTLEELPVMQDASELIKVTSRDVGLSKKPFVLPVVVAGGLMFFSQFSGIDGILTYAGQHFREQPGSHTAVVILYFVQLITTLVCFAMIDSKGRKTLLLVSTATTALAALSLGLYVLCEDIGVLGQSDLRWIPVCCVIVYCGAFALGLGPIPWLLIGELLPARSQGSAAAIIATLFWAPSIVVTSTFGDMQNAMYLSGTFWFYTIFCLFGYLFVLLVVPDIRQRASIEQIQLFFLASSNTTNSPYKREEAVFDSL